MNEQHGWRQVSGHCFFSCCPKCCGEGHCEGELASSVPRLGPLSAYERKKALSHNRRVSRVHPTSR